jgi:hypothetical protein
LNYGKTIKIFLPSGKTNELKIASIANSTVQATLIPRNIFDQINNYKEISTAGVYFLLDNEMNVYVGEAESVTSRVKRHDKDEEKDWWNILITINVNSLNSPLTKAHVKYLEGLCYKSIKEAGRYNIENTVTPATADLPRSDIADMMHLFDDINILVSTLGYLLFEAKREKEINTEDKSSKSQKKEIFTMNVNGLLASGEYNSEGFLLYKDSKITKSPKDNYKERKYKGRSDTTSIKRIERKFEERLKFLSENKIKDDGSFYTLKEDILFNTPSGAASFVAFDLYNGWDKWKNKSGETLQEVYRKEKSDNEEN